VQLPPGIGHAEGMDARLIATVLAVIQQPQRQVEEHLLGLCSAEAVLILAPARVARIPLEAGDALPVHHG
jgi:hypothetical protein